MIKELGFSKLALMALGAVIVDFMFLVVLWMLP